MRKFLKDLLSLLALEDKDTMKEAYDAISDEVIRLQKEKEALKMLVDSYEQEREAALSPNEE